MHYKRQTGTRMGTLLAVLASGALAMSPASLAAPAPPPQPVQDSVTGAVGTSPQDVAYNLSARSGPSGENPNGQVTAATSTPFFGGSVTCLAVRGNVALLKVLTTPEFGFDFGLLSLRVTDNAGSSTPDLIEVTFATGGTSECSSPESTYIRHDVVVSGDIAIVDAQPFPTSKDQCKNGGWRSFGDTFKNQGQCVAFVERGPKP
jgi:hypothetical protein